MDCCSPSRLSSVTLAKGWRRDDADDRPGRTWIRDAGTFPLPRRAAGWHVSLYVMCLPHRARSADRRPGASQAPPGLAEPTHQCHGDSSVTGARRLAGASRIEGPAGAGLATGHTTASSSSLLFRFLKTPVALRCGLAGLTGITCPRAHTHRLAMISPPLTWAWHREMQRQMDGCGCGAQRRTRDTP
jgi:hypothetical protein